MSPIRPVDGKEIRVVYNNPSPYISISGGPFTYGATINHLQLTPQEAEELRDRLQQALLTHQRHA